MGKQRKYMDRGRRIALEGRPCEVEWMTLLGNGRSAVVNGRADDAPFLDEVMWEGIYLSPTPRPAALDHPFLRSVLDRREDEAIAYLTERWSLAWVDPLPQNAAAVREALDLPDCAAAGSTHLMTGFGAKLPDGPDTWYTGYCIHCMRAMLMQANTEAFSVKWWPFYDQETA